MSETKQTPGPWRAVSHWAMPGVPAAILGSETDTPLFEVCAAGPAPDGSSYDSEKTAANAERAVACVNACEGLSDERVKTVGAFLRSLPPRALDLLPRVIADARRALDQTPDSTDPDGRMSMREVAEVGETVLPLLFALADGKDGAE